MTILGAGKVGSAIGRLSVVAGHEVTMVDVIPYAELEDHVQQNVAGARAGQYEDLLDEVDLVVFSVPLHAYQSVPADQLAGRTVIDLTNYWESVDGGFSEFGDRTVSEFLAAQFPDARWVKTLNHIACRDMEGDAAPAGVEGRRALAVASDDRDAARAVMQFLDDIGFDPVDGGSLADGAKLEPGTEVFSGRFTKPELEAQLQDA